MPRFMSSYEEVFIRHAPWERSRRIPKEFDVFGKGLTSYQQYEAVFCPPELNLGKLDCRDGPTHENGILDSDVPFVVVFDRFRPFLSMPHTPFNVHLYVAIIAAC